MVNRYSSFRNRHRGRSYQEIHKDRTRIYDIITKAGWVLTDMIKLAETMCKLLGSREKAVGRAQVAAEILGSDNAVTQIFSKRAIELGADPSELLPST